jgi:hypothetical protein
MIADLQRELAVSNAERDAALAREAAMAEVLQVVNSSPGDLAPVFDTMPEKATRLCEAPCAMLWTYDENKFAVAATFGVTPAFAEFMRQPLPIQPSIFLGAIQRGEAFVHNIDLADTETKRGQYAGEYGDSRRCGLSGPKCRAAHPRNRCWLAYCCH